MTRYDKLIAILKNNTAVYACDTCYGSIAEDVRKITVWYNEFQFLEQVKRESTNPNYVHYFNTEQTKVWDRIEQVLDFYNTRLSAEAAIEFQQAFFSR